MKDTQGNSVFSQSGSLQQPQDLRLLQIFNYYRVVLSFVLLFIYFNEVGKVFIGLEHPLLFFSTAAAYTLINVILIFLLRAQLSLHTRQLALSILVDIFALALLTYANGGVGSGFGNLIIIAIAAGSILATGRFATILAAVASIAVILIELYRAWVDGSSPHYFQAGILGIVFFATALFIRKISRRIYASEQLATQRADEVASLEKLNQLIIQRMRTGILVCDNNGHLHMMNKAAEHLLGLQPGEPDSLYRVNQIPGTLLGRLKQWQSNPHIRSSPFQNTEGGPEVQANFTAFRRDGRSDVLIFLEDNTKTTQQAQQLKLASLGQLTASIAHEIRNPLGAISHAAQLLRESPDLDQADLKLANIVQDHSKRMNSTIENILELSRRRPALSESISLKKWLEEFVTSFSESEERKGNFVITIEPLELEVRFDPSQLQQVITNLAKNALRYSEKSTGRAEARFSAGILANSELPYLDVINPGLPVPDESVSHLFEPFYTTERTGTGLGLYISRELCEANNARLDYIPSYTDGCCFRIIFPHPKQILA